MYIVYIILQYLYCIITIIDIKIASCSGECGSVAEILPRATDSTGEPTKAIRGKQ